MLKPYSLLKLLADGALHSGQQLASELGVSRMAVWKAVQKLIDAGVAIDSLRGRGYRVCTPYELLDAEKIRAWIDPRALQHMSQLEIFPVIDSTNTYLMRQAALGADSGHICLAESQTAGKGRRGRHWQSPFGVNLYLSLLWRFDQCAQAISAISLLASVAIADVLRELGLQSIGLKWPNDLVVGNRKLGGILLEMHGEVSGRCDVVCGVGINCQMSRAQGSTIDQPWISIREALPYVPPRNELAGRLIGVLIHVLRTFDCSQVLNLQQRWDQYDVTQGKSVTVHTSGNNEHGLAQGIDEQGRFVLKVGNDYRYFNAGEVSLRVEQ